MKRKKDNKSKINNDNIDLSSLQLQEIELLKEQMFGAVLGVLAELKFYTASYEEIYEICNEKLKQKNNYIDSNKTYYESAQLFFISQLIFTKVSLQYYYLLLQNNVENNIDMELGPEEKINISCILNSLGNIYFLQGIQGIRDRENNNPIVGD